MCVRECASAMVGNVAGEVARLDRRCRSSEGGRTVVDASEWDGGEAGGAVEEGGSYHSNTVRKSMFSFFVVFTFRALGVKSPRGGGGGQKRNPRAIKQCETWSTNVHPQNITAMFSAAHKTS